MNTTQKQPRSDFFSGRERFLEAADRVFIREGYDGSTIRAIASEAKTSLARLSRHWTGKEDLFTDVFARHFNPIHDAQNARFDALEAASHGGPVDPRKVIEAFFAPALEAQSGTPEQQLSHQLYCRAMVDPAPEAKRIVRNLTSSTAPRIVDLLRRALPGQDKDRFFLVVAVVLGAYVHPQLFGQQMAEFLGLSFADIDWNQASSTIAEILVDGLAGAPFPLQQAS